MTTHPASSTLDPTLDGRRLVRATVAVVLLVALAGLGGLAVHRATFDPAGFVPAPPTLLVGALGVLLLAVGLRAVWAAAASGGGGSRDATSAPSTPLADAAIWSGASLVALIGVGLLAALAPSLGLFTLLVALAGLEETFAWTLLVRRGRPAPVDSLHGTTDGLVAGALADARPPARASAVPSSASVAGARPAPLCDVNDVASDAGAAAVTRAPTRWAPVEAPVDKPAVEESVVSRDERAETIQSAVESEAVESEFDSEELESAELESEEGERGPIGMRQQVTRGVDPESGEYVYGLLRAEFPPGSRSESLHVAFCPPLPVLLSLDVRQVDGPAASVTLGQCETFGARIDVRLHRASGERQEVLVQFETRPASSGSINSSAS